MILQDALRGLFANQQALHRASEVASTGERIQRVSDQPLDASAVIRLDSQLRVLERYRRASVSVTTRLSTEEAVLNSVDDLLRQAEGLAAEAANTDDETKGNISKELSLIREQIISLGNTRVSGEYIFAGSQVDSPPFSPDGSYVGGTGARQVEIADGLRIPVNHTGDEVLPDVLGFLDTLVTESESGTPDAIRAANKGLKQSAKNIERARVELGTRMNHLDRIQKDQVRRSSALLDERQALQAADPAESILKLSQAKTSLEMAYKAVSEMLSTNILQFLR